MHAVMRNTGARIRSNDGYQPHRGGWASSHPALEHMECQGMVGWGTLPQCHKHWKRECKRMMSKSWSKAICYLLPLREGCLAWCGKSQGLRGGKENRMWGGQGRRAKRDLEEHHSHSISRIFSWTQPSFHVAEKSSFSTKIGIKHTEKSKKNGKRNEERQ